MRNSWIEPNPTIDFAGIECEGEYMYMNKNIVYTYTKFDLFPTIGWQVSMEYRNRNGTYLQVAL